VKQEIVQIKASDIIVDPTVQRELRPEWARKISRELNIDRLGVLTASRREGGTTVVIDGQHRLAALELAGMGDHVVDVRLVHDLSLAEEAGMFRTLNTSRQPTKIDMFRLAVVEGEPSAREIQKILHKHGWQVTASKTPGSFAAICAIQRIFRADGAAAYETIASITSAWGNQPAAVNGHIVAGIGNIYVRYGENVGVEDMSNRLAGIRGGPSDLFQRSRALADARGRKIASAVSELVVVEYNKKRSGARRLPDWV
jgi:spore maturation protein SpmB